MFTKWIQGKFLEWREQQPDSGIGRSGTISAYADHVGVSQPVMSQWLNGTTKEPDSAKYVYALMGVYGGEVLRVLNIKVQNEIITEYQDTMQKVASLVESVPGDEHQAMLDALREWAIKRGYKVEA